jgi:hypothetical protein
VRSRLNDRITEFYLIYRNLKFAHSLALLREHFLGTLNAELRRPMSRIGLEGILKIEGLPSAKEIARQIERLMQGELKFGEVIKFTHLR